MKRLPRARIHSYYNPMNNKALDVAQMSKDVPMLENGITTYSTIDSCSGLSAYWGSWSGGINYNNERISAQLDPSTCQDIPSACNGLDHFLSTDLYRLQNPSAYAPISERPVLVREIVKNYLQYPEYHLVNTDLDTLFYLSGFDESGFSATSPSVFKGNINLELCKCKETCECKQQKETPKETVVTTTVATTNACNCLEQFEIEYQKFIEMLKKQREEKLHDTEEMYLSAWEESGCKCEQI